MTVIYYTYILFSYLYFIEKPHTHAKQNFFSVPSCGDNKGVIPAYLIISGNLSNWTLPSGSVINRQIHMKKRSNISSH